MKKAILCIGNPMRGDDDVGNEVGRIVETELKEKGADLILKKPIDFAKMLDQVKSFIEEENIRQSAL